MGDGPEAQMTHGGRPAVARKSWALSAKLRPLPAQMPWMSGRSVGKGLRGTQGGRAARREQCGNGGGVWPRTWPPGSILRPAAAPQGRQAGLGCVRSWPRLVGAPSVKPGSLARRQGEPTDTTSQMWLPASFILLRFANEAAG